MVINLNSTLKSMMGIQTTTSEGPQTSNPISGMFSLGDAAIDNTQLRSEFENKYLQKTNYVISDLGVVT